MDYNTKDNPLWKLNAENKASFSWGLSCSKADYFTIAITSYKTIDGVTHKISDDDIKWTQFYYPSSNSIIKNSYSENKNKIFTTTIDESLYGKQFFPINLTAGTVCTAHFSWAGKGNIYLVYAGNKNVNIDKDGNILLSQFSKGSSDYFAYKFSKNKTVTFIVPKDGLYVLPVKNNKNITRLKGKFSCPDDI